MKITSMLAALCLGAATITGQVIGISTASAAVSACNATNAQIYSPPASVTGSPGDVLACESTSLPFLTGAPAKHAYKVQYVTTDAVGALVATTGLVIVPDAAWTGTGSRPTVSYAPFTHGSGQACALSVQLSTLFQDAYESPLLGGLLGKGYAVVESDGVGYMTGETPLYVNGLANGHALLDVVRAARNLPVTIPGGNLSPSGQVALDGYSEGGSTSLWAAQLAASYAPDLDVVGDASGGVPADLEAAANELNGGPFAGFLADSLAAFNAQYPTMPFTSLMNANGQKALKQVTSNCLIGTVLQFAFANVKSYSTQGLTLPQIYALQGQGPNGPTTWGDIINSYKTGVNVGLPSSSAQWKIGFPVFQYRAGLDEILPMSAEDASAKAYCTAGIPTEYKKGYLGDHALTLFLAGGDVSNFLADRFAGKPFTSSGC